MSRTSFKLAKMFELCCEYLSVRCIYIVIRDRNSKIKFITARNYEEVEGDLERPGRYIFWYLFKSSFMENLTKGHMVKKCRYREDILQKACSR